MITFTYPYYVANIYFDSSLRFSTLCYFLSWYTKIHITQFSPHQQYENERNKEKQTDQNCMSTIRIYICARYSASINIERSERKVLQNDFMRHPYRDGAVSECELSDRSGIWKYRRICVIGSTISEKSEVFRTHHSR